ncbi:MAG TPA: 2-hydroxyacid dehydrogenase [Burkholderiaceae bacterium]|jgi:lactate dehydrogenase-like 2-hydroxyacid dehydrogenase
MTTSLETEPRKIDVLMAGPQVSALADAVEREYTVHKLWLASDRAAFLAERAPLIRGIVTNGPVGANAELMAALPKLEIISSSGVGTDAIDLAAAKQRGVIVTNTPGVLNDCVADTGLMLMLATARRLGESERFVRAGQWATSKFPLATSLGGKTCAILGMGNIGLAVAKRAQACGMKIAYLSRSPKPALAGLGFTAYTDLESLARDADFLVLTLPGGAETRHIVDERLLNALGPTGHLINIARGSVVDEAALIRALQAGTIAGAGLDVFEDEPRVPAALLALDNVVLTPHIGSATIETRAAMSALTFDNLHAHFTGKPVLTPVV